MLVLHAERGCVSLQSTSVMIKAPVHVFVLTISMWVIVTLEEFDL